MVLLSTTVGLPSRIRRLGRALDFSDWQDSVIAVFYCFVRLLYLGTQWCGPLSPTLTSNADDVGPPHPGWRWCPSSSLAEVTGAATAPHEASPAYSTTRQSSFCAGPEISSLSTCRRAHRPLASQTTLPSASRARPGTRIPPHAQELRACLRETFAGGTVFVLQGLEPGDALVQLASLDVEVSAVNDHRCPPLSSDKMKRLYAVAAGAVYLCFLAQRNRDSARGVPIGLQTCLQSLRRRDTLVAGIGSGFFDPREETDDRAANYL